MSWINTTVLTMAKNKDLPPREKMYLTVTKQSEQRIKHGLKPEDDWWAIDNASQYHCVTDNRSGDMPT